MLGFATFFMLLMEAVDSLLEMQLQSRPGCLPEYDEAMAFIGLDAADLDVRDHGLNLFSLF